MKQNMEVEKSNTVSTSLQANIDVLKQVFRDDETIEMSVSAVLVICVFIKLSVCLLGVCNGISKIFNLNDHKFLATPIAALMFSFSLFIYTNTMEMNDWAFEVWLSYFKQSYLP